MTEPIVQLPPTIVIRDLATKLGLSVTAVAAEVLKNGIMISVNEEIDFDTAAVIAEDLGKKVALAAEAEISPVVTPSDNPFIEDPQAKLVARAPVVVVMGHVDHGKTSLLDAIRKTEVARGEAGGITQSIGAYQVTVQAEGEPSSQPPPGSQEIPRKARDDQAPTGRLITFIDTPGHEAFTQMRSRGATIADVAILVVAAEEGLKPQTFESLKMIHTAGLPFLVALTKADKAEANPERVKKELAENEVLAEEYGGKVPIVVVSAKTGDGIPELLESILLLADVDASKLMVNPERAAVGTIIESHVDPKQGPLCSALVQTGTLKNADEVVVGQVWGKIRSMKNDRGQLIKTAPPSTAVQILGLKAAPQVGDIFRVDRIAAQEMKKKTKSHQLGLHTKSVVGRRPMVVKKSEAEEEKEKKIDKLFLILKTDTLGSAEAILELLKKIEHAEVAVEIVQRGLGIISEADVLRAEAAHAVIIGFNVPVSPKAEQLGRSKSITMETYDVIYQLVDAVTARLETMLKPLEEVKDLGGLKVLAVFRNEHTFQVVGGKVISGKMAQGADVRVERQGQVIGRGRIGQLQSNKANVKEIGEGNECGLKVENVTTIQVGDDIITSITEQRARKLAEPVPASTEQ